MSNLVLTRKAGQSVRLMIGGNPVFACIWDVTSRHCEIQIMFPSGAEWTEKVRFKNSMGISEGVTVTVLDLAKGHAKLSFTAPRDVHILRNELIKDKE